LPDDDPDCACLRITLPPLRERPEDIPALTDLFLERASMKRRLVSPSARHALASYVWPGNVTELRETCAWIARTCSCAWIKRGCLPSRLQRPAPALRTQSGTTQPAGGGLDQQLRELETLLITRALVENSYNRSRTARALKIKRSTLGDRIKRLRIAAPLETGSP
jgi:DNA-binding NtrC family response regulator